MRIRHMSRRPIGRVALIRRGCRRPSDSFRPQGIVGPNCAKDDGRHGPKQFCPNCMAARDRFVGEVQAADELFDGAATAGSQDYRWRRAAGELQGRPTTAAAAAEPEAEALADPGRTHLIEATGGADTTSFAFDGDFVQRSVDSGCAIA